MVDKSEFLMLMLVFTALMGWGVNYYSIGFFLTRYEIDEISQTGSNPLPPQFNRTIILLVDALRYDFAFYNHNTTQPMNFENKLTVFDRLMHEEPENTWLFRFLSDPPTVTMQRIKGMTTGSLPTFIDFKENFASNSVSEDNLLLQMHRSGKKVIFMGDDTWVQLYPSNFYRTYPFDSFNVKDLHTVDNGVISNMFPEMETKEWDLIIGHMLGVDHVGHRYYANHPSMADKLLQVNSFIANIIEKLEEDTLFLVIGDHGMTDDGNHGGTSEKETNTILFAYSKRPFAYKTSSDFPLKDRRNKIHQIDLVPTMSILLGVPIPFNSLGSVIPELFTNKTLITESFHTNAEQVKRYISTYDRKVKKLPEPEFENLEIDYESLVKEYSKNSSQEKLLCEGFYEFIHKAADMCRMIWTTFDIPLMIKGIIIQLFTFILIFSYLNRYFATAEKSIEKPYVYIAVVIAPIPGIAYMIYKNFKYIRNICKELKNQEFLLVLMIQVMHSYGLFSNSYILQEDTMIRFFLLLMVAYVWYHSDRPHTNGLLLTAACIRLTASLDKHKQIEKIKELNELDLILMQPVVSCYIPTMILLYILYQLPLTRLRKFIITINTGVVFYYWFSQDVGLLSENSFWIKSYLPRMSYIITLATLFNRDVKIFLASFLPSLLLILGEQSPIVVLTLCAQIYGFYKELDQNKFQHIPGIFIGMTALQYFFSTGHRSNFPSLQIGAAFTGFEVFNYYLSGILLIINTFGCLLIIFVVHIVIESKKQHLALYHIFTNSLRIMLIATLNTAINRRHLMVWPIFAPKYIFDLFMSLGSCLMIFLSYSIFNTNSIKTN
jgi:hypothetical protein